MSFPANIPSRSTSLSRHAVLLGWIIVASIPLLYIGSQIAAASRNIVFWDEIDTALDLIIRINAGADWKELLGRFFAVNNEHRTVTSRLLYASSYWLTGTVNFHFIGAIGNAFIFGACALLVSAVQERASRLRLAVVLAFLIFQLEHFENFLWSGASIDHFQVVLLAISAIVAVARGTRPALALAGVMAVLATFTLTHGILTWPIGAIMLAHARRWRHLKGWIALATLALLGFFQGFEFNPGHHVTDLAWAHTLAVVRYWFALLGAAVTYGNAVSGQPLGLLLVGTLAFFGMRGTAQRYPVPFFTALFCIGALALVALGRTEIAPAQINSRYMILSALAWSMVLFMILERLTEPTRPFHMLAWMLPALAIFNVAANIKFAPLAEGFVEVRDRAASRFEQYGEDGRGLHRLHPRDRHADILLKMAAERGIYRLPRFSQTASFPDAELSTKIVTHLDELITNSLGVTVGGWAMLPGELSKRGNVYLVLRSEKSQLIFSSITLQRPDVAKAYKEPRWRLSGFRSVITDRLPAENFAIGVLIESGGHAVFTMTPNRLRLDLPTPVAERLAGAE